MSRRSYDRFQGSNDEVMDDTDPVFQDESGKWNFWDKQSLSPNGTFNTFIGPYDTEEEAEKALEEYISSGGY